MRIRWTELFCHNMLPFASYIIRKKQGSRLLNKRRKLKKGPKKESCHFCDLLGKLTEFWEEMYNAVFFAQKKSGREKREQQNAMRTLVWEIWGKLTF